MTMQLLLLSACLYSFGLLLKKHLTKFNSYYLFDKLQPCQAWIVLAFFLFFLAFPDGALFSPDMLHSFVIYKVVKSGG